MDREDMHSLVYSCMLAPLNGVIDNYGNSVRADNCGLDISFNLGYEARPDRFEHNYQRNKFLHSRDKYIVARTPHGNYHLLTEKHQSKIIIYSDAVSKVFGQDKKLALDTMKVMFGKVYKDVSIEAKSGNTVYDQSAGMGANHARLHEIQ